MTSHTFLGDLHSKIVQDYPFRVLEWLITKVVMYKGIKHNLNACRKRDLITDFKLLP